MREYQVVLALRLTEPLVQQIAAVHPGVHLHRAADEVSLLLGRAIPPGLPGMRQAQGQDKAEAEARLNTVLREAEIYYSLRVLPDLLSRAPKLRWVQICSHGIDHLRGSDVLEGDILLTTGRGNYASVIAEHALAMMLMLVRDFPRLMASQRQHKWDRIHPGELQGATLGLVGLGSIGQEVARRARAFGMRVIGTKKHMDDNTLPPGLVDELIPPASLDRLLGQSDFVLVCVPYTGETRHLIGQAQLRAMKPTAYLLNVARGGVVDEEALITALREGWIAGAGLDVFRREPLPPESPLWDMPNVIVTPHMAGFSHRFMERATECFCENLRRYIAGEPLLNVLDRQQGY